MEIWSSECDEPEAHGRPSHAKIWNRTGLQVYHHWPLDCQKEARTQIVFPPDPPYWLDVRSTGGKTWGMLPDTRFYQPWLCYVTDPENCSVDHPQYDYQYFHTDPHPPRFNASVTVGTGNTTGEAQIIIPPSVNWLMWTATPKYQREGNVYGKMELFDPSGQLQEAYSYGIDGKQNVTLYGLEPFSGVWTMRVTLDQPSIGQTRWGYRLQYSQFEPTMQELGFEWDAADYLPLRNATT
jgi:hypothetical protein